MTFLNYIFFISRISPTKIEYKRPYNKNIYLSHRNNKFLFYIVYIEIEGEKPNYLKEEND